MLEESGLAQVLVDEKLRFVDLNRQRGFAVANAGQRSGLVRLTLPVVLAEIDWIVSLAKLKTHHWAGATLSMKNLFGLMPGSCYGWPKNVLHYAGLQESILDINATVRPQLAIVDGIVGMEGDGPIIGTAKTAGVLVVGTNLPAVDATAARVMGHRPGAHPLPRRTPAAGSGRSPRRRSTRSARPSRASARRSSWSRRSRRTRRCSTRSPARGTSGRRG